MVSSKDSFSTLNLTGGPTIHMGDDSQILVAGRGSIKIQQGEFKNVLYVPSQLICSLYTKWLTLAYQSKCYLALKQ